MTIRKTRYLYEILVRGNPDGTLAGAHQVLAERVADGDLLLAERTLEPTPLDVADVGAVLGEAFASLARDLATSRADLDAAIKERDGARASLAALAAQRGEQPA
jgi:hypothetical protein